MIDFIFLYLRLHKLFYIYQSLYLFLHLSFVVIYFYQSYCNKTIKTVRLLFNIEKLKQKVLVYFEPRTR